MKLDDVIVNKIGEQVGLKEAMNAVDAWILYLQKRSMHNIRVQEHLSWKNGLPVAELRTFVDDELVWVLQKEFFPETSDDDCSCGVYMFFLYEAWIVAVTYYGRLGRLIDDMDSSPVRSNYIDGIYTESIDKII